VFVLHLVPSYWPAVRYGGPIRSVHGLCKGLAGLGHRVTVLTTDVDGPGRLDVPTDRSLMLDGVEVRYLPVGWPRRITRTPAMRAELRRRLPSVDLVHLHAVWQWPTWIGARMAERANVPYVVSPRGMLVRELIERKSPLAKKAWLALVDRATLARSAFIHCTSEIEAAEIRALGLDLAPLVVVPNGVDVPDRAPPSGLVEEVWAAVPRGRRILFLGRVNWTKGIDRLVRAMADVRDGELIVAGNDEEGAVAGLARLSGELGLERRVRFIGAVEGERKWALLSGADLLVLPSLSENWGLVATEALAVGTPVVVTQGVGAAGVVAEEELGLVVDGVPEALAAAIRMLLADPDRRRSMGERGRRIVRERFSHEAVARQMLGVYEALLGERRAVRTDLVRPAVAAD
jgi:glycosyltransferase involved in cell wall biosynthesis